MGRPARPPQPAVATPGADGGPEALGDVVNPAPCCAARDVTTACRHHLGGDSPDATMDDDMPAAVAHAEWALENDATLHEAAAATGLSEQFVGLLARPMWTGRSPRR
jgi:hypothetical protein